MRYKEDAIIANFISQMEPQIQKSTLRYIFDHINSRISIYANHNVSIDNLRSFLLPYVICRSNNDVDEWKIYIFSDLDIALQFNEHYFSDCYTIYMESSGGITITDWISRIRYHIFKNYSQQLNYVQDIYCGIRRILQRSLFKFSFALLHGAAFMQGGKTFCIAGKKGAGKSYMLFDQVFLRNADLVASDKTLLWMDNDNIHCTSLISTIKFNFCDLQRLLISGHHQTLRDTLYARYLQSVDIVGGKAAISPFELERKANIKIINHAVLDCVILIDEHADQVKRIVSNKEMQIIKAHFLDDIGFEKNWDKKESYEREQRESKMLEYMLNLCEIYLIPPRMDPHEFHQFLNSLFGTRITFDEGVFMGSKTENK